jgi:hypothetical protein
VRADILAPEELPRTRKRAQSLRAIELFRDDTSYVTTVAEWREMAVGMGAHNQGGPAVGYLAELPTPTVPRGMSMAGMDHAGMDHAAHAAPDAHADHARPDPHAHHAPPAAAPPPERGAHAGHDMAGMASAMHRVMEFIVRLLADPQVEARIHADPRLHEIWSRPAVQQYLQMIREMHGGERHEHERHDHERHDDHDGHGDGDGDGHSSHGGEREPSARKGGSR